MNCSCAGDWGLRISRFASDTERNHQMTTPTPAISSARTSEGNPRRVTWVMVPPPFASDRGRDATCLRPTVAGISTGDGVTCGPCRLCAVADNLAAAGPQVAGFA
ncbi:MAG: hypothetical protein ACKOJF_32365, partial [Planctomycetaceae bacterium]